MLGYEDDDLPKPEIDFNKEFSLLYYKRIRQGIKNGEKLGGETVMNLMLEAVKNQCKENQVLFDENTNGNTMWKYMETKIQDLQDEIQ